LFHRYYGPCTVELTLHFPGKGEVDIETSRDFTIRPCPEFTAEIDKTIGSAVVSYTRKKTEPRPQKKRTGVTA